MSKTPIHCLFCDVTGTTVLAWSGDPRPLLLALLPHTRHSPNPYACRKCLRLRWRIKDHDFEEEVRKLIRRKQKSAAAKSATSRQGSRNQ